MRTITSLAIFALALASTSARAEPPAATGDAVEAGFQSLFNGETLDGWDGDTRLWSVRDGVIHGETTSEQPSKGNTFLIWQDGSTKDFELRLTFRCNATNNSGIQYRSKHITDKSAKNDWVVRGYQHEIRNEIGFPNISGFIYGEGLGRGRVCMVGEKAIQEGDKKNVVESLITPDEFKELFRLDDWNDVKIVCKGRQIQHYLNGRLILDFTDSEEKALLDGVLALQLHGGKPMWAEYKNIRFKSL